jgi:hypothetical protein
MRSGARGHHLSQRWWLLWFADTIVHVEVPAMHAASLDMIREPVAVTVRGTASTEERQDCDLRVGLDQAGVLEMPCVPGW